MNYPCIKFPLLKQIVDHNGVVEPKCNSCLQTDCSNPIRKKTVSVMGINREWSVFMEGTRAFQVVQCEGYIEE